MYALVKYFDNIQYVCSSKNITVKKGVTYVKYNDKRIYPANTVSTLFCIFDCYFTALLHKTISRQYKVQNWDIFLTAHISERPSEDIQGISTGC